MADSETAVQSLSSLPPELLACVLRITPFHCREDGTVAWPDVALVCKTWRTTIQHLPDVTLRCSGIRRCADVSAESLPGRRPWTTILRVGRPPSLPLRPTTLDLYNSDVPADALRGCANAATRSNYPLRALALRRCHSVGSHGSLPSIFAHVMKLQVFVCTGHALSAAAIANLGKLSSLRVLCVAECTIEGSALMACLPQLSELRCLLLGGARLLNLPDARDPTDEPRDGLFSLNLPLEPPTAAVATVPVRASVAPWGDKLKFVEWTFLPAAARQAILSVTSPSVFKLDLCSSSTDLEYGLSKISALIDHVCDPTTKCVGETALAASLSARCAGFHETALHHASIEGDLKAAELLIRHGAAVDVKDAKGCTPLARAIFWGHAPVCRLLLSTNACDLDVCNHAAESPTYLAALRGHAECLQLLLEAGGNYVLHNEQQQKGEIGVPPTFGRYAASKEYHDGYTPLHAAVISRSLPCTQLLLDYGFAPSAQNRYQQTALHIAASLGAQTDMIELLLTAGCCTSLKDERGHTALQVAKSKKHDHVARCLAAHQALKDAEAATAASTLGDAATDAQSQTQLGGSSRRQRSGRARSRGRGRGARGSAHVAPPPSSAPEAAMPEVH